MYVNAESLDEEVRVTVDAAMELGNVIIDGGDDVAARLRGVDRP